MNPGTVVLEQIESAVLKDNAPGDPARRIVPIYLPPAYAREPQRRFPVIFVLTGFTGRGRMLLNDNPWSPSLPDRMDALIGSGASPEAILVMPDCFTRFGGSQYLNSSATGRYADHLLEELVPHVDATFRTLPGRAHRGVAGKSSGGYGALVMGLLHADVFGAVACHSGDVLFDYCYRVDVPKTCTTLQGAGGARAFLERFEKKPQKDKDDFLALNILAMAACYSPDPAAELGIGLPFDLETGAFRDEVWARWLALDPLRMLADGADALRSLRLLYLDCGTKDEFHLHHGARLFTRELRRLAIAHEYQEFDDGHMNVSYRYDVSLPKLARALAD